MAEQSSHILVLDDDSDMLQMLETILMLDGFRVTLCDDPEKPSRLWKASPPTS